jgi:hypothetical protein
MTIEELFKESNYNKFSFVLLAKENIDHDTVVFLEEKLKEKVNVVSIKSSKYSREELTEAIDNSHFVITGIGQTLDLCIEKKKPTLVDVSANVIEKQYPSYIDFFDPYRNENPKPYYKEKDFKLFVKEVFNQLDRYKIDYVNINL